MKIARFLVLVIALGGFGCSDSGERSSQTTGEPTQDTKLVFFTWEDYIDEEVVAEFTEETGIEVEFVYFDNPQEMKALLQSNPGVYDLAIVDDYYLAELIELRLIERIDSEKITNLGNYDPRYLGVAADPENEYSVPYVWGTTMIAYRADLIEEEPETSWNLLWDPALKGHIGMLEDRGDIYAGALFALGHSPNSEEVAHLQEATEKLIFQADKLEARYADLEVIEEHLITGNVWAAQIYSGDAAMLAEDNENIDYFIPNEGAPLWLDNFVVPRHARNASHAHRFIDFMSRGEIAGRNSNYLWTATPNRAAEPFIDQELKDDVTVNPSPEILEKCEFFAQPSPKREEYLNRSMRKVLKFVRDSKPDPPTESTAAVADPESEED